MDLRIFYAWQSDIDRDLNQRFIRHAAEAAITKLKADIEVEDAPDVEIELDHDTKGVTGTPHIAETIKAKIRDCTIFLADVTHVSDYITSDGRKKKGQNPNVLVELGLALADKGAEKIVLVQNTAYGPPEELPFDLRHHRFPVGYKLLVSKGAAAEAEFKSLVGIFVKAFRPLIDAEHEKTRAEAVCAAEVAALSRDGEVKARREAFDRAVAEDKYQSFNLRRFRGNLGKIDRPMIAVSIYPVIQPADPIDLGRKFSSISKDLRPLFVTEHETEIFSRSVVSHASKSIPSGLDGLNFRFTESVIELSEDGCIFAAEEFLRADQEHSLMRPATIDMHPVERQLLMQLRRYIQMLHEVLGVAPPLLIALSILKPAGIIPYARKMGGLRGLRDDIIAQAVLLRPDFDITDSASTIAAIATAMRPSFDLIWRSAGLRADPFFDDEGRFRS